jgi:hypothetical protein
VPAVIRPSAASLKGRAGESPDSERSALLVLSFAFFDLSFLMALALAGWRLVCQKTLKPFSLLIAPSADYAAFMFL